MRFSVRHLFALVFIPAAFAACKKNKKEINNCEEVAIQGTRLTKTPDGNFVYRTSGGGTIEINVRKLITFRHDGYPTFKIELWGETDANGASKTSANHENLNGKHIKDRVGNTRTMIFPDGAKITLIAQGEQTPMVTISIYDGTESHRINAYCNTIEHSSLAPAIAKQLDDAEADGETASFEITATGLLYFNKYTEATPGNKVELYVLLGELVKANPNRVDDFYDDPRLGHT